MTAIRKKDIIIERRWIADCLVCDEAVEPMAGSFGSRQEAEAARDRHLALHRDEPEPEKASNLLGIGSLGMQRVDFDAG